MRVGISSISAGLKTAWILLLLCAASCGEIGDCWPASLEVITETTGASPDMDGYELIVPGSDSTVHLDLNGLRSIGYGADGDVQLELRNVAPNCSVVGGANRQVKLSRCSGDHFVTFEVVCAD